MNSRSWIIVSNDIGVEDLVLDTNYEKFMTN